MINETDSYYDAFIKHIKKHDKFVKERRTQYVSDIANVVRKHYRTLEVKYEQLVYTDDYGIIRTENFITEFNYFVNHVLFKEVPYPLLDKQMIKSYNKLIQEVSDYKLGSKINAIIRQGSEKLIFNWLSESFFCFSIKFNEFKLVHKPKQKLVMNFDIVEYPLKLKEQFFLDDEMSLDIDKAVGQIFFVVYELAITMFEHLRILHNVIPQTRDKTKTHETPYNPLEYEKYIATLLKDLRFKARQTKATGDQGADVLAEKNGISFAIQCKMYSKPVGNKAVQEANAGRDFYKCDYAVVVSNAGFTKSAKQAANACKVILLNDNQLEKLSDYTNQNKGCNK